MSGLGMDDAPARVAARFRDALETPRVAPKVARFLDGLAPSGAPLVAACSGGSDSVAALLLMTAESEARGGPPLVVAHYNHRWRGAASEGDAAFAGALAETLGWTFRRGVRAGDAPPGGETEARDERHRFLRETARDFGAAGVIFGHQRDDVLETALLRLSRGASAEGMAAPRPVQGFADSPAHLRPLLDWPRERLRRALLEAGGTWRDDASNADATIARNAVRHRVIPALRSAVDHDPGLGAARARRLWEEDAEALDALARERWPDAFGGAGSLAREPLRAAPAALARRAILGWAAANGWLSSLSAAAVEAILEALRSERPRGRFSAGDGFIAFDRERVFREAAAGSSAPFEAVELTPGERAVWGDGGELSAAWRAVDAALRARIRDGDVDPRREAYVEASAPLPLRVRPWRAGDRFRPLGAPGERKLKDWFMDRKIPRGERRRLPVVCDRDGAILWIPRLPPAHARRLGEGAAEALELTYRASRPP